MGYCYDQNGRLCCDRCDAAGGVRRHRCPFNWCSSPALCVRCAREVREKLSRKWHVDAGCERGHLKAIADHQKELELLAAGKAIRCSALGLDDGRIHVLFRLADKSNVGRYMAKETYHAIPSLTVATIEDYEKFGPLEPAPSDYVWKAAEVEPAKNKN